MNFRIVIVLVVAVLLASVGSLVALRYTHKSPAFGASSQPAAVNDNYKVRYLPLGDSYTIGQSEPLTQNFPSQLVNRLRADGVSIGIVANPAVTGYTSQNLIDKELPLLPKLQPTFVTILIGVNDYVQGVSRQTFRTNLEYIVNDVQKQLQNPQNIVLITVPDFGKTPTGAQFGNPATLSADVQSYNAVIKQVASAHNLLVADIFPISQAVASDSSLIAGDGLHPSSAEYTQWLSVIYPAVMQRLQ